ncbi:MAG TPA: hypothetical protein PLD54_00270 [Candidatus Levybacteria bacterium]|nr:hypothetical protein [Candidatus Levybacteria bacterium]
MITLIDLITIAPLNEEFKKELLTKVGDLTAEQKFELEDACWQSISQEIENKLQYEAQVAMNNVLKGEDFTFDLQKREQELYEELAQKFDAHNSEEKIEEIREKLQEIKPDSTPQPN